MERYTTTLFLAEYQKCGNAFEAASIAGCDLGLVAPLAGSYVYFLLCPDTSAIRYVGKGTGRRMHHHLRDAKAGRVSGVRKHRALAEMLKAGKEPVAVVFQQGLEHHTALEVEKEIIEALGHDALVNTAPGTGSGLLRALAQLDELESRIMPYDLWLKVRNPKPEHRKYHGVVLSQIAETRAWIQSCV